MHKSASATTPVSAGMAIFILQAAIPIAPSKHATGGVDFGGVQHFIDVGHDDFCPKNAPVWIRIERPVALGNARRTPGRWERTGLTLYRSK